MKKFIEVEKAIVSLLDEKAKDKGRGVLVGGNIIVTAAHCIDFECNGYMVLGKYYIEEIRTVLGELKVTPLAVEPVSDIAVLGSLDGQEFYDESVAFDDFCEKTKPVPLYLGELELFREYPVYIYNHKGKWVTGRIKKWERYSPILSIQTNEKIEEGASGGPIINESGKLIGIASNFSQTQCDNKYTGRAPYLQLALPVWVISKILGKN